MNLVYAKVLISHGLGIIINSVHIASSDTYAGSGSHYGINSNLEGGTTNGAG